MARLYSDENIPKKTVEELRRLGHDILTAQEAGNAILGIPDDQVLAFAVQQTRAVLTHNRRHFIRLHTKNQNHWGIVVCSKDQDFFALAQRIHNALAANDPLDNKLVRVNKS